MNQHHVLRMLREKYRLQVKRMKVAPHSLHDNFGGHLRMNRTEVRISSRPAEGERELFVRVQNLGLERLRVTRANYGVRNVVAIDPRHRRPDRDGQLHRSKTEVVDLYFHTRRVLLCAG